MTFIPGEPTTYPVAGETFYSTLEGHHDRREVIICGLLNSLNGSTPMIAYKTFQRGSTHVWMEPIEQFLASSAKVP